MRNKVLTNLEMTGNTSPMNNACDTRLQKLRDKARPGGNQMTLSMVADLVGVDITQVSRWERFERDVPEKHRRLYAMALGVSVSRLAAIIAEGRDAYREAHAR